MLSRREECQMSMFGAPCLTRAGEGMPHPRMNISGVRAGSASDPSGDLLRWSRHVRSLALAARIFPSVKASPREWHTFTG